MCGIIGVVATTEVSQLLYELDRTDSQWGAVAMCAAGGMGSATIIERV